MKTKLILFLFCLASLNVMGQGTITRKKQQTATPTTQKPAQKSKPQSKQTTVKMCDICEKPLSKCDYGGKHPYCQTCGKLRERCEYNGNHDTTVNTSNAPKQKTLSTTGTLNGHEWVDLGLSVKWATCNIGAANYYEYGAFFAWGEIKTKSCYDWQTYFDVINERQDWGGIVRKGGNSIITQTNGLDAAQVNWGGTWRMPSEKEFMELCVKCKWTWVSEKGHNGFFVKGPNGNVLFIPASGYYDHSKSYDTNARGFYWSSERCDNDIAWCLKIDKNTHEPNRFSRACGLSIRPVTY